MGRVSSAAVPAAIMPGSTRYTMIIQAVMRENSLRLRIQVALISRV